MDLNLTDEEIIIILKSLYLVKESYISEHRDYQEYMRDLINKIWTVHPLSLQNYVTAFTNADIENIIDYGFKGK